ncbi:MAG: ABC transporter permease [Methylococcales bacterium]|jgi:putative ABC transport system permease protein
MNNIQTIPLSNLAYTLIPVALVLVILFKWKLQTTQAVIAISRMLLQLLVVGYFLNAIFASNSVQVTLLILTIMLVFASWIALGTVKQQRRLWLKNAIFSLIAASGFTLFVIVVGVLELNPWYQSRYIIPLGGMILANSMTSISLAAERFDSEYKNNGSYIKSRNHAFNAAMIPTINTLLAVGLVALPGMMTGQILSGVSPFIAARYQIMVMCMLFASSGIAAACFLSLIKPRLENLADKN